MDGMSILQGQDIDSRWRSDAEHRLAYTGF